MNINELAKRLHNMYTNAPDGDQVAMIHLFRIKYGEIIVKNNYKATEIVCLSGIRPAYTTEVSKGIKLSKYVLLRDIM